MKNCITDIQKCSLSLKQRRGTFRKTFKTLCRDCVWVWVHVCVYQPFHNPLHWIWYAASALPDSARAAWSHQKILLQIRSEISVNLISQHLDKCETDRLNSFQHDYSMWPDMHSAFTAILLVVVQGEKNTLCTIL